MCTSFTFYQKGCYFGRNLDLDVSFGERVVFMPRKFSFPFRCRENLGHHYALLGMANVTEGVPLYAEAVNEKGLYMAGLYFPENAYYAKKPKEGCENIAPYELIPYILGACADTKEAQERLLGVHLIAEPFSKTLPLAPLHWHVADGRRSLTIEPLREGLVLQENPAGVLTNNPPFSFHMQNLTQYLHLTPNFPENRFSGELKLSPFGQGMGAFGLPGDASPPSRFVRAAFLKENARCNGGAMDAVTQVFHILDAVSMVRGSVITKEGGADQTRYCCCIDGRKGIYYYKTYENSRISAICMQGEDLDAREIREFPLLTGQDIRYQNA